MSTTSLSDLSGQELGQFRLEKRVAATGLGATYQARDLTDDHLVYLVLVPTDSDLLPDIADRFRRRITTVAQLKHPGISPVIDLVSSSSGFTYAAVDFSPGISLAERLDLSRRRGEPLSVTEALLMVRQIADALSVSHPVGIIHYHLTPEHILVSEDSLPRLVDLAVPVAAYSAESGGEPLHAPRLGYLPTEQLQGKALSGQSNIYSLGIILYELIAGERPEIPGSAWDIFDQRRSDMPRGLPLEEIRPELSAATHRVVRDCLWREEWNRYETVNELKRGLDRAINAENSLVKRRDGRFWGRRKGIAVASLVVILLLLVFVLLWDRIGGSDQSSSLPHVPEVPSLALISEPEVPLMSPRRNTDAPLTTVLLADADFADTIETGHQRILPSPTFATPL